MVVVHF